MESSGRKVSFTDLWGLIVEYFLQQKVKEFMLVFQLGPQHTHMLNVKKLISLCLYRLFGNRQCCGINIEGFYFFLPQISQHPSLLKNFEILCISAIEKLSVYLE